MRSYRLKDKGGVDLNAAMRLLPTELNSGRSSACRWGAGFGLLVVLDYSRLLWLHPYPAMGTMWVLTRGLEQVFMMLGGVPA